MRPTLDDVIRATADCGITSPNEKIVQHLAAKGYEIPDDIECLMAAAVRRMLEPPIAMISPPIAMISGLLPPPTLFLIATIPPVDPETFRSWRIVFPQS